MRSISQAAATASLLQRTFPCAALSVLFLALLCGLPRLARAAPPTPPDFQPDPRSVQRYGPAYRYPQSGWIVLHIEGEPYERGVQHGRLLAPEIAAQVRCLAERQSPKAPADGWKAIAHPRQFACSSAATTRNTWRR